MRNATVQIVQDFTTDHAAAAKALRLPLAFRRRVWESIPFGN